MNDYQRTNPFRGNNLLPPVLKYLLIINVAIFVIQNFFIGYHSSANAMIQSYFALQPLGTNPTGPGFGSFYPWQLISYQFLHDGFMHVGFNMFALWMFGAELETLWGSKKFLFYYLLSGIGAGLAQLFISPLLTEVGPTIGASGAVYGILLAFGLTFPKRPIFMFPLFIPIPARIFVLGYAVIELYSGITGSDGVAHFAHLGGAATGFLLLRYGDKLGIYRFLDRIFSHKDKYTYEPPQPIKKANVYNVGNSWQESKPSYYEPEETTPSRSGMSVNGEEITQAKIDEILDKISAAGYQNLTEREKRILFELSKKL
jgi:membrane associated rhomboid family serine protease